MGADASKPGEHQEPDLPDGEVEVRLSVYSLDFTGNYFMNSLSAGVTGAYHSGIVVFADEWAFGGHDEEGKSGIYRCKPELNQDYQFHSRLVLGRLRATKEQVLAVLRQLGQKQDWLGSKYDLIEHNCNHFASDLCWALLRRRPPDWVNKTAEGMAKTRRMARVEKEALRLSLVSYRTRFGAPMLTSSSTAAVPPPDAPGARAFSDTFSSTFEMAKTHHQDLFRPGGAEAEEAEAAVKEDELPYSDEVLDLSNLPKDAQDIVALRRQAERDALTVIVTAAKKAAHVVASAARQASAARAHQSVEGIAAWDVAWARESAPLLKQWREEAASGDLLVAMAEAPVPRTPEAEAHALRDSQVKAALEIAAEEAADAAETKS